MSLICVLENNAFYEGDHVIKQTFMKTVHSNSVMRTLAKVPDPQHTNTDRHTHIRKRMFHLRKCYCIKRICLQSVWKVNVASSALYGNLVWSLDGMQTLDCGNEAGCLYISLSLSSASCLSDNSSTFSSFLLFWLFIFKEYSGFEPCREHLCHALHYFW